MTTTYPPDPITVRVVFDVEHDLTHAGTHPAWDAWLDSDERDQDERAEILEAEQALYSAAAERVTEVDSQAVEVELLFDSYTSAAAADFLRGRPEWDADEDGRCLGRTVMDIIWGSL
jgi:hypothetical protein